MATLAAASVPADALRMKGTVVIANIATAGGKFTGCQLIWHGDMYAMIYRPVFGPASRPAARRFMARRCR